MVIFETPVFTTQIMDLMDDEEYAEFQTALCKNPKGGELIQGTGGLRKIRYGLQGRGKRGGARMIYYWLNDKHQIYMFFAYPKK
jgi:mRNA-degrading endonuclease RelE of RelBE toxin-antitoxin system